MVKKTSTTSKDIMSLQRRRERKIITHAFKIKVGLVRNDVNLVFETNQRTQRVRSVRKSMPGTRGKALDTFENGFSVHAGKLWKTTFRVENHYRTFFVLRKLAKLF